MRNASRPRQKPTANAISSVLGINREDAGESFFSHFNTFSHSHADALRVEKASQFSYEREFKAELLDALDMWLISTDETAANVDDVVKALRHLSPLVQSEQWLAQIEANPSEMMPGLTSNKEQTLDCGKAANILFSGLLNKLREIDPQAANVIQLRVALNEIIQKGDHTRLNEFTKELISKLTSEGQIHNDQIEEQLSNELARCLAHIRETPGFDFKAVQNALKLNQGRIASQPNVSQILINSLLPQQILANELAADCDAYLAAERDEIRATWEKIKDANSDWSLTKRDGNFYMKHRTPHQGFSTKEIGEMYPGIKPVLELCAQHNAVNSARRELAKPKTAKQNIQDFRRRVTKIRRNPYIKPSSRLRELLKSIERKLSAMTSNVKSSAAMFSISTQSRAEQTLGLLEERLAKGTAN